MENYSLTSSGPEHTIAVQALHAINTLFTRVYHHLTVVSPSILPRRGPGIVVCNHISSLDPLLIQSACTHRLINWMMAKEYLDLPYMGQVFRAGGVIPVDRGSRQTGPMRAAFRQLSAGRIIGIFPEGKISTTGELLEFQSGAVLIAMKANVPIFPAYVDGTQRDKTMTQAFLQRMNSVIAFGPSLQFSSADRSKQAMDAATESIKSAMKPLKIKVDALRSMG